MAERTQRTWAYRVVRRVVIAVIGGTIVLLGVAMLVLPGPGLLTIVGGLAVLGLEFAFARRWLARAKESTRQAADKARDRWRAGKGDGGA
ncbi:MAG: PGPGW domain-containing protein [Candidatus Krumholzibacteria bacterium]|nr:PGPGW domain-containing protein [Candidatus Krumholzibacteria bacterium]MDH4336795.1 PGPGW domain-containing protein [Candidatus Krumholzibacteria bacterium]MDH5269438.1 PGPGW domain-containing protein [Candidatus Krumholzibacteria bacterium]